jgi:hypothetical protein
MLNRFKKTDSEQEVVDKKPSKGLKSLVTGSFLSKEKVVESLPFVFFLSFLGICYIANGYQAEKVIRQLYKTTNNLKELRSEYITTKSDLMVISKQSQVANATAEMGLRELTSPPKKIVLNQEEKQAILND